MRAGNILGLLACIALAGGVVKCATFYLDRPEVLVNDLTGKCVEVRDPAAEHEGRAPYTCDHLPEQYERVVTPRN